MGLFSPILQLDKDIKISGQVLYELHEGIEKDKESNRGIGVSFSKVWGPRSVEIEKKETNSGTDRKKKPV